jgi:hypothetical protein
MPKNTACPGVPRVTDPITDQEMAFARLILSGTMTDRQAAEAAGLNPDTAAYTKAKPRVRVYMLEHSAAVRAKLVDQEAEALRKRNIGRDQILARLWELAHVSPETTKGSIAGQIKAMSMIVAIEGLISNRRLCQAAAQPPATPLKADIPEGLREEQHEEPGNPVLSREAQPAPTQPAPAPLPRRPMPPPNQPCVGHPFTPTPLNRVSTAADRALEDLLCQAGLGRPISPERAFSRR